MQTTSHILMIRPVGFGYNAETAVNNAFQVNSEQAGVQLAAVKEFDAMVALLRNNGVDVTVVEDTAEPHTPDSIFPNNWISFHSNGDAILYPMFANNRRAERKQHVLDAVTHKFRIHHTTDLSIYEQEDLFLEGTGSMVLDRDNRIAYACLSPRTNEQVLAAFCRQAHYSAVVFDAVDEKGQAIYHTNVMMCVAATYLVICLDAVANKAQRRMLEETITRSGKTIIPITLEQMNQFAGNMLQVENSAGEKLLVMSSQAYESLSPAQVNQLSTYNKIIHSPLTIIEKNGGGSARCMMAEIHLPLL